MVKKMFIAALAAAALTCMTDAGSAEGQYVSATGQGRARNAIAASMKDMPGTPRLGAGVTMHEKKMTDETAASTPEQNFSRSKRFIHRFYTPENASNELIVLLHGSGGNEASLVPMAQRIWPRATLLGIRGRVMQDGGTRWYKRITPVKFDQKDIRLEANAFVTFLTRLADEKDLDLSRATFVGYSNGAGFLGAVMRLYPGLIQRAALFRGRDGLEPAVEADLTGAEVLLVQGAKDLLVPSDDGLAKTLESLGAAVQVQSVSHGHALGPEDRSTLAAWLDKVSPIPAS